jgi:hypothetical protein
MKRLTIALCILLLFALTSAATTPTTSTASLKGTYVFMFSNTKTVVWGQTLTCSGFPSGFYGGSRTEAGTVMGTLTFDGAGGVTGSFNEYGKIDQTSSDNSVSCGNNGNAVFFPSVTGTLTGTYTVLANGTGTLNATTSGSQVVSFNLLLAGNCASTGVNDAILLENQETNNRAGSSGSARLQ